MRLSGAGPPQLAERGGPFWGRGVPRPQSCWCASVGGFGGEEAVALGTAVRFAWWRRGRKEAVGVLSDAVEAVLNGLGPGTWVAVSGMSCSGKTAFLRALALGVLARGGSVLLTGEPMEYEGFWDDVRVGRDVFCALDGLTRNRDEEFVRSLPADRMGAVAFWSLDPEHAWNWVLPQEAGARVRLLFLEEVGEIEVTLWDGLGSCAGCWLVAAADLRSLLARPWPVSGLVQVEMLYRFDGSRCRQYKGSLQSCKGQQGEGW